MALIVQPAARRPLHQLLGVRFPDTPVLSLRELPDTQAVEVVAVLGGTDVDATASQPLLEIA